ncbi:MAG: hypothetical protein U0R68_03895 [Candidatus Nanopelagicales bacterium]
MRELDTAIYVKAASDADLGVKDKLDHRRIKPFPTVTLQDEAEASSRSLTSSTVCSASSTPCSRSP